MACNPVKCATMQMVVLAGIALGAASAHYYTAAEQRSLIDGFLSASSGAKSAAATGATGGATPGEPNSSTDVEPAASGGAPDDHDPVNATPHVGASEESQADPGHTFSIDDLGAMITVEQAVKLYNLPYEDPSAPLVFFFDAREEKEYLSGHIPAAYNVTPQSFFNDTLPAEIDEWPKDSIIIVYCEGGDCDASHLVETRLRQQKLFTRVYVIGAGLPGWRDLGLPTETGPRPSN